MTQLVLTFEQVGRQLMGVSARTVRRLVERGELPTVRIGTRVGVPARAVEEWVDRNTEAGQCHTAGKTRRTGGSRTPMAQGSELASVVDILTTGKRKRKKID
jgi:excisionase family DNA binding protein